MAKKNEEPNFEKYLEKLESVMEKIEKGDAGLQDTIAFFEEGMGLVKTCRGILDRAELKINKLMDGSADETAPFGGEDGGVVD